ncbi:hypothetical protein IQ223_02010 [Microcystis aeruginosa LEGE 00239]|uniref:hypothetical protein n=1 Tax=Microcystis aeruginosa TaxID=1126 RepID=UPI00187E7C8D|nr:hypothetical protein [Microcystis aeruginosa]MBE9243373.1 hypothetical protein [Microcystis aeruginosa LEGE 00239]
MSDNKNNVGGVAGILTAVAAVIVAVTELIPVLKPLFDPSPKPETPTTNVSPSQVHSGASQFCNKYKCLETKNVS